MIVPQTDSKVVSVGFDTSVTAKVKEADMGFMFKTLASSLYKNKLGSLIRETVCNCFDAYVGTGKTPVALISYNHTDHSISFIDKGKGMSKEFIEGTYIDFFDSTKRQESGSFGAFGLGGKVGLAISDQFYIESIKDGVKCLYIYSYNKENPNDLPTLDLLNEVATDEENGTTIKVHLPHQYGYTAGSIDYEIASQLRYFDSVIVEGAGLSSFNPLIYKGKNYIVNVHSLPSRLEVCFGKVRYSIDNSLVQLEDAIYQLPLALNFDLNTPFFPTPSREELQYTPETIQIIRGKAQALKEELEEIWKPFTTTNSILHYKNVGGNDYNTCEIASNLKIESRIFKSPVLTGFDHCNFKSTFTRYEISSIMEEGFGTYDKGGWSNRGTYWGNSFLKGRADQLKAQKLYYPLEDDKIPYEKLIRYFYYSADINVGVSYKDIPTKSGKSTRLVSEYHVTHNPKNIDYKSEIRQFLAKLKEEMMATYTDIESVEIAKSEKKVRTSKKEILQEHDPYGSSRSLYETPLESLEGFEYLVILDPDVEKQTKFYTPFRQQSFEKAYEQITGKSIYSIVRFVSCNKVERKKVEKLENAITLEKFFETKLYTKFIDRINKARQAQFMYEQLVAIRTSQALPRTFEFRMLLEEVKKARNSGRYDSQYLPESKLIITNAYWQEMFDKYRYYNPLRTLKNFYRRKLIELKQS